jgi:ribosomal protein S18 acetylase RimI-like enzyme
MLVGTVGVGRSGSPEGPRRFELVHIAVAAEYQRGGVGKSLMARLEELLARPDDCVQAAVPESNLAVQLFLRSLGYKAVRVLHGYYGAEDGYAMEWRRAWGATAGPLTPSE